MTEFSRVAIIFNPKSTGDAPANARGLQKKLESTLPDLTIELLPTQRAGHAIDLAYDFAKKYKNPLIISASGDGGYNEVVNGALRAQNEGCHPICAVLPSGNANDHARTMHDRPLGELVANGMVTSLDVMEITTHDGPDSAVRYAHSYVGIGLTPTVALELNKRQLNRFVESWLVLRTFWRLQAVLLESDEALLHVDSLTCSIIPEMAKVLTFSKQSHPQDGLFELTVIEHRGKLRLLFRLLRGMITQLGVRRRVSEYAFTTLQQTPIQFDGEVQVLGSGATVSIRIRPTYLRAIASV